MNIFSGKKKTLELAQCQSHRYLARLLIRAPYDGHASSLPASLLTMDLCLKVVFGYYAPTSYSPDTYAAMAMAQLPNCLP